MPQQSCRPCHGSGRTEFNGQWQACAHCNGRGRLICHTCDGSTRIRCARCDGSGRLLTFTQLVVNWFVHESEQVFTEDTLDLPKEEIKRAQAITLIHEEGQRVCY